MPALTVVLLVTTVACAPVRTPEVGFIVDRVGFTEGGCELWLAADRRSPERYIFFSDFEGNAVVNLNGRDVRLTLVRSEGTEGEPKKGDGSREWYESDGVSVRVEYVAREVCREDDESCEVTHYDAMLQVVKDGGTRTVRAQGLCGS